MSDPMADIRASFFIECDELLEALQDGLQSLQDGADDSETINVVFRAVHSIKGGAGAFGLDAVVSFAHVYETALDEVRSGKLAADDTAVRLFFQCADVLADLVHAARDEVEVPAETTDPLIADLKEISGQSGDEAADEDVSDFQPMALSLDLPGLDGADVEADPEVVDGESPPRFRVRFRPEPEMFRTGNEPLHLLTALADLGPAEITCQWDDLPDLADYSLPSSHLTWEVLITADGGEAAIREVFEFVDGLCILDIDHLDEMPIPVARPAATAAPAGEMDDPPASDTGDVPSSACAPAPQDLPPAEAPQTDAPLPDGPPPPAKASAARQPAAAPKATVRVDLDRIDRLVNLVGELVINQAMLAQTLDAAGMAANTKIASGLDEFQQLTRDIQDSVMMIRAQPVKSLFQRMARIVREASAAVEKDVRLKTEGESTEIDKTVIERLADPLTHMIRNAVDHGLEKTKDREVAGKPTQGTISLTAAHRSGRVVIEVSDDGGGINRPKVRQIAIDKGLIPADADLSDTEIDNLLFLPGFSTANEVSNLSGRGVGMDVVRNAITALGGRITITSVPGRGTTFSISLPLTLAVLDGMVIRIGEETLVMPLNAISETLSLGEDDVRLLGPNTQVVAVRDSFVPLVDLGTELGYSEPRDSYVGAIVLLVAQESGDRAALVVDEIEDQRQVVIKGLNDTYGRVPGIAAATILGDGQIALILDPTDLLNSASGRSRPGDRADAAA